MAILPPGFISDRSGNFGIMTALLMVPLLGMAGMAVDFAHAMSLRTQLFAAFGLSLQKGNVRSILLFRKRVLTLHV